MQNFAQPGNVVTLTAPMGGVVSGSAYVIGNIFCVATATVAVGLPFEALLKGVVELPKTNPEIQTLGQAAYWDGTQVTNVAGANKEIGMILVADAAGTNATTRVRIVPIVRASVAA